MVFHVNHVKYRVQTVKCPTRLIRGSNVVVTTPMVAMRGCSTSTTTMAMPTATTGGVLRRLGLWYDEPVKMNNLFVHLVVH
jgi:hypothetical protein